MPPLFPRAGTQLCRMPSSKAHEEQMPLACKNIWHLEALCEITYAYSKSALHNSCTLLLGKYYICLECIYLQSRSLPFTSQLSLAALTIAWLFLLDCSASWLCSTLLLNKMQRAEPPSWFLHRYEAELFSLLSLNYGALESSSHALKHGDKFCTDFTIQINSFQLLFILANSKLGWKHPLRLPSWLSSWECAKPAAKLTDAELSKRLQGVWGNPESNPEHFLAGWINLRFQWLNHPWQIQCWQGRSITTPVALRLGKKWYIQPAGIVQGLVL